MRNRKPGMDWKIIRKKHTIPLKTISLISALSIIILFSRSLGHAQDFHGFFGYFPPLVACTGCHDSLLADNHKGDCWACHNMDYSLKFCTVSYPSGFDFTTVCDNYQTPTKEPFSCGDCHLNPGDHTSVHDQTLLPADVCSQCHLADAPAEHLKHDINCSTCHDSFDIIVNEAIERGKSGMPVYCSDCHGSIDHETHKHSYLPYEHCSECHLTNQSLVADIVNEHANQA